MGTELIKGKVAKILNSTEVVLNIGSNQNVKIGMIFSILDPKAENVIDPDTKELLGSVDRPKVRVKVIRVQEKLSLAKTYEKIKVRVSGGNSYLNHSWADLFSPPKFETKLVTLRTDEKTWEDLDEIESYVKTGDPVVEYRPETEVAKLDSNLRESNNNDVIDK